MTSRIQSVSRWLCQFSRVYSRVTLTRCQTWGGWGLTDRPNIEHYSGEVDREAARRLKSTLSHSVAPRQRHLHSPLWWGIGQTGCVEQQCAYQGKHPYSLHPDHPMNNGREGDKRFGTYSLYWTIDYKIVLTKFSTVTVYCVPLADNILTSAEEHQHYYFLLYLAKYFPKYFSRMG